MKNMLEIVIAKHSDCEVYEIELFDLEKEAAWSETIAGREHAGLFLKGVEAACGMLDVNIKIPNLPE